MRPRPSCRGEHRIALASDRRVSHSFNAATAFVPWRTRTVRAGAGMAAMPASMRPRPSCRGEPRDTGLAGRCSRCSFNAATAFVPWRTHSHSCCIPVTRSASMRPRPSCRGERSIRRAAIQRIVELQCGHGLRAVENICRRIAVDPSSALQCGHGLVPWRTSVNVSGEATDTTLQCGHGLRAVENSGQICGECRWIAWLQCGHGLRAVENVRASRRVEPAIE